MSNLAICRTARLLAQVAAVAVLAGFSAGCSSDVSRFGNLFGETDNQDQIIGRSDPMPTGSINSQATYAQPAYAPQAYPQQTGAAPAATYSSSAVSSNALPPAPGAVVNNGAFVRPAQTAALPPPVTPAAGGQPQTPSTATVVTIKPGDSVQVIARRYGVAESSLLAANGLVAGAQLTPGMTLVIPAYTQPATMAAGAPNNAATAAASPTAPGPQVLGQLPPTKPAPPKASVANEVAAAAAPIKTPAPQTTHVAMATPTTSDAGSGLLPPAGNNNAPAKPVPQQAAAVAPSQPQPSVGNPTPASSGVESAADGSFRWPVRGRVISAFGQKPGGERNDGINIEVPEGTPIKAAEGGQVIYAGNELKGFGNLVLVKHPNGFVSAYAHASELLVQRGDNILRGQTIAKVGSTGNVSRPQLHFEIRNGNRPVDPLPYLSG